MPLADPRKFSFVMMGRIISAGLQALFYLMFAAILDPQSYGNLSYMIALAGTFSIISRFGLNHSVIVYQAKNDSSLSNSVNVLAVISTSAASIILLTFDIFAAVLCIGLSLFIMNIHNLLGLKEYKKYMTVLIGIGILIISIPIGFYFVMEIPGILLGMAISYLLCSFHFLRTLSFKDKILQNIRNNSKVLIHNFGVDFSIYAPKFIDKLVVFPILGFTSLGIYQLNIQILFGLEILPIALHSFLLSEESSGKKHNKISFLIIFASVIVVALTIIISPFFIEELFPKYSEGIPSLQILIISIIPLTISAIFNAKLQARESTIVGYSAIVRVGTLLILIAVLGSLFGLMGLSLAVLFSTIFYTSFLYVIFKKSSK